MTEGAREAPATAVHDGVPTAPAPKIAIWLRGAFITAFVVVALFRFFLTSSHSTSFLDYRADDLLFLSQAKNIVAGKWLGAYDQRLLMKGPGYALFIAASHVVGVPLHWAEEIMAVVAAAILVSALRRLGYSRPVALGATVILLLGPSHIGPLGDRVLREGLYYSQIQIILGLAGHLLVTRKLLPTIGLAVTLGIAVTWTLHTREESPFLLPALLLFVLGRLRRRRPGETALVAVLKTALVASVVLGIHLAAREALMRINERHYGTRVVVERTDPDFDAAMGALLRVAEPRGRRYEPLDADLRQRLYELSPTFAELKQYIESPAYRAPGNLEDGGERTSDYFIWCVRDAAAVARWHRDASTARARYRALADEVNRAVDLGLIPGGRHRTTPMPRLRPDLAATFVREAWTMLEDAWRLEYPTVGNSAIIPRVEVGRSEEKWARDLVGDAKLAHLEHAAWHRVIKERVFSFWRAVTPTLLILGAAALVLRSLLLPWRCLHVGGWMMLAISCSFLCRWMLLSYMKTGFLIATIIYFLHFYSLASLASLLAVAEILSLVPMIGTMRNRIGTAVDAIACLVIISALVWLTLRTQSDAAADPVHFVEVETSSRIDFGDERAIITLVGTKTVDAEDGVAFEWVHPGGQVLFFYIDARPGNLRDLETDLMNPGTAQVDLTVQWVDYAKSPPDRPQAVKHFQPGEREASRLGIVTTGIRHVLLSTMQVHARILVRKLAMVRA